jgi:hypothetical protein
MKIISYALFGYNKERQENCFAFADYLRGLLVNIRLARMVYPGWVIRLHVDQSTYDGLKDILTKLPIQIEICDDAPLTLAMLWRLKPCFDSQVEYTICRDLDSPLTYREAQAVEYWLRSGKAAHAITDSVSHNIPMMGGMVGFWKYIRDYTGVNTWEKLVDKKLDFKVKGMDQFLLNKHVYPGFSREDSIVQHYVLGMPDTFLSEYHTQIQDIDLKLPQDYKETNDTCGHIGAAGYYSAPMNKLIQKHRDKFLDLEQIEKNYPTTFYWNEGI